MNRSVFLVIWLTIGCQLLGCHHEVPPELPSETTTGKDTFGCLVNGKVWLPGGHVPAVGFGKPKNLEVELGLNPDGKTTNLSVYAQINQGEKHILFFKSGITTVGSYRIGVDSTSDVHYRDESLPKKCWDFYYYSGQPGKQVIDGKIILTRYDSVVSGRFSFTLVQPGCDTIRITDGRFDIKI
ncbi:DUF6252 family protein [Fibrella aquatilis]|uniref:Lipoprotein n=1 Tax=Fibrella aquatilis TaxID=2817059 RepID=A0A939G9G8_9BACT|nr:DUF6252 family protein [Fibrella aquatilis]MBO0933688.1 hypothetical protein [Fibrella aquatilis]